MIIEIQSNEKPDIPPLLEERVEKMLKQQAIQWRAVVLIDTDDAVCWPTLRIEYLKSYPESASEWTLFWSMQLGLEEIDMVKAIADQCRKVMS